MFNVISIVNLQWLHMCTGNVRPNITFFVAVVDLI